MQFKGERSRMKPEWAVWCRYASMILRSIRPCPTRRYRCSVRLAAESPGRPAESRYISNGTTSVPVHYGLYVRVGVLWRQFQRDPRRSRSPLAVWTSPSIATSHIAQGRCGRNCHHSPVDLSNDLRPALITPVEPDIFGHRQSWRVHMHLNCTPSCISLRSRWHGRARPLARSANN